METHILFFILAGLLIAILIGASVWSARREKSRVFSNTFSTRPPSTPINNGLNTEVPPTLAQGMQHFPSEQQSTPQFNEMQQQEIEQGVKEIKISLPGQEMHVQPEVHQPYSAQPIEPQPVVEPEPIVEPTVQIQPEQPVAQPEPFSAQAESEPQIVTLYVVAPEGQQFNGELVVQNLEAIGLQFGEYNIFHRHLDNASSPVLFSVANMMQPGVFDLNNIEHFSTVGLVFFMHLPSAGNDLANLKLMIRTVESFAQSVGGFVLDEQRQIFDDAARQNYLLRVSHH